MDISSCKLSRIVKCFICIGKNMTCWFKSFSCIALDLRKIAKLWRDYINRSGKRNGDKLWWVMLYTTEMFLWSGVQQRKPFYWQDYREYLDQALKNVTNSVRDKKNDVWNMVGHLSATCKAVHISTQTLSGDSPDISVFDKCLSML